MISESTSQLVKLLQEDKQADEKIESQELNQIISKIQLTEEDIFQTIKQNDNKQFSLQTVFRIICKKYGKRCLEIEQIIRMIPHYVKSYELFIDWWQSLQNAIHRKQILSQQIQQTKQDVQKPALGYYDRFTSRNPIKNYQKAVDQLCSIFFSSSSQNDNLKRLSSIILYEDAILNKYRLQINPNLVTPNTYLQAQQVKISLFDGNIPVKVLNSLTIDEERQLDQCGLLMINQKYYALPINLKRQFQNMAAIAYTLDPHTIFYKTKNFYLWEPISEPMPKGALQYRWRLIPSFAKLILNQISKAHELGFSLPHLRWCHLNKTKGIQKVNYPCSIDKKGQIKQQLGWNNLDYQDAYCCPQFLTGHQKSLTYKCDSWVFGCLLYEFIYNHPPASFLSEIKKFVDESKQEYSLTQLLEMEQLPITFCYSFFVEEKLKKLIALEHQLRPNIQIEGLGRAIKRQQSLRGLMKPLQIIFGDQYKSYENEFELLKQINTIIYECLNPNPLQRPSIKILQEKSIFSEGGDYQMYKNILDKHNNCLVFYDRILQPVISMLSPSKIKNTTIILKSLKDLHQNISIFINCKQIGDQFIIPKRYVWPSKNRGIYSDSLLESKQKIRRTNNFNIIALLFNSGYFQSIIYLSLISFPLNYQVQNIFECLLDLFVNFLFTLKDYKSLFSGYIKKFIDYILRIIYEEPFGIIYKQWIEEIQLPQRQQQNIINQYKQMQNINYLRPHSFNSRHCLRAIRLLQQITYITGQGNIQFTPIRHFLIQNSDVQDIIQLTHNQIKLVRGPDDTLIINYFRDRIEQQKKAHQQLKMKVEVDLLRFLQNNNEIKTHVLVYYRDIISMYHSHINLLKKPYVYLIFASILRDNLESLANKIIVLEIICSIIDREQYLRYFKEASSNLISQILRLMIEPPKTHASHDEYLQLQPILNKINQSLDIEVWGDQSIGHSILYSNQLKSEKYDQQS